MVYVTLSSLAIAQGESAVFLGNITFQFIAVGLVLLLLGFFLLRRSTRNADQSLHEWIRVLELVQKGSNTERATIVPSDEHVIITFLLNHILEQYQIAQSSIETRIKERVVALENRSSRLLAAAQIAREAASYQDIKLLLSRTTNLIADRFNFYHVGIFLLDDTGEYVVLQAASSDGGKHMISRGHRLQVGRQGIVGEAAYQNFPRIVLDVDKDISFIKNADLPLTRSEVAFPLTARNNVIGVLDIQSIDPTSFSKETIELLQTMADQIALAIQNTILITESQNSLRQLETISATNVRQTWLERVRQHKHGFQYTPSGVLPINKSLDEEGLRSESGSISEIDKHHLGVPITLRGQPIGTISLNRKGDSAWGEAEKTLATEIANQVGLALENARLLDEAQRHAAQEQSISQLTAHLSGSLDPDNLLQTTVRELHQIPNVSEVSIIITPPKSSPESMSEST